MAEVLLVGDDALVRAMLAGVLVGHGFSVRQVDGGDEAMVALEASPPDVMVLDLMAPNSDGSEILTAMRERDLGRGTRVLILSCRTGDDFMPPLDPDSLVATIDLLLTTTSVASRARRGCDSGAEVVSWLALDSREC